MLNRSEKGQNSLIKQELLNPSTRFVAFRREGKAFQKRIRRNLNDPVTMAAIQHLRDQVFFHSRNGARTGRTIGLAGPRGREGATSVSILLGLALGGLKRNRVVFLDGRLERKSFALYSEVFGLTKSPLQYNNGCGNLLCYSTKGEVLSFLAAAPGTEGVEFFSNDEVANLIADLRSKFDYIIFDMPPLLRSSETRMLLSHLDLFYLVCAARKTLTSDLRRVQRLVSDAGGTLTGAILNRQKIPFWASLFWKDAFF